MKMKEILFLTVILLQFGYSLADDQVKSVSCKSITARFKGVLQNKVHPNVVLAADFQVRLVANDVDRQIYHTVDYWNNDYVNSSKIIIHVGGDKEPENEWEWTPANQISTTPFLKYTNGSADRFLYHLNTAKLQGFVILIFPDFKNTFKFNATNGGGCTTKYEVIDNWAPNSKLFDFCLCCDEYAPNDSLSCPYK